MKNKSKSKEIGILAKATETDYGMMFCNNNSSYNVSVLSLLLHRREM